MGFSGTTYGGADMITVIAVLVVVIVVAVLIWLATRKKDGGGSYEEPEEDSWILSEAEKKEKAVKEDEKEPEKKTVSEKKTVPPEKRRESDEKKAAGVSYGRGMTKKKTEQTKEKEWESVIVYSYSARSDIWHCIYCDGENPMSVEHCQVCGKKRQDRDRRNEG